MEEIQTEVSNAKAKNGTTKTRRFLDQCLGRIAITKDLISNKINI